MGGCVKRGAPHLAGAARRVGAALPAGKAFSPGYVTVTVLSMVRLGSFPNTHDRLRNFIYIIVNGAKLAATQRNINMHMDSLYQNVV